MRSQSSRMSFSVNLLAALLLILLACDVAAAQSVPLPGPRPQAEQGRPEPALSACRLRLTADFAVASSLPALVGPGECGSDDVVQLEAVVLADKGRIAIIPPAIL